ncbi:MAG: (2Fe-2S) ferredoxin domain-containing protein [Candidatus Omnitrophica bacterium]|nr:(2Fe-2S) ferredoxin domain-containing protein [Candidatus Omnitrophota bacterium]
MERSRVPYQKILFVCVNRREPDEVCCSHRDSEAIAAALKTRVKGLGLSRAIRVSKSGCQDLCAKGPNVMVFPDYVWYHGVTQADAERIIQDAIRGIQQPTAATTSNPALIWSD